MGSVTYVGKTGSGQVAKLANQAIVGITIGAVSEALILAEAAGEPKIIPHETAIKTREFIANDIAAWASYQPAFDKIIKMQPDLLDYLAGAIIALVSRHSSIPCFPCSLPLPEDL